MKKAFYILLMTSAMLIAQTANYTIREYDNLWTLAETHLGDAFRWQDLWQSNNYISNPDMIFPGNHLYIPDFAMKIPSTDTVKLYDTKKSFAELTASLDDDAQIFVTRSSQSTIPTDTSPYKPLDRAYLSYFSHIVMRQAPFLYTNSASPQIPTYGIGKITDNRRPFFSQNISVSARLDNKDASIKKGTRLDIFDAHKTIEHDGKLSSFMRPVGSGIVQYQDGNSITLFVDKLWGRVENGCRIAPVQTFTLLGDSLRYTPKADTLSADAIARIEIGVALKPFEVIIIDKGQSSGVHVGDHFVFYKLENRRQNTYAHTPTMEGFVIRTEEHSATIRVSIVHALSLTDEFWAQREGRVIGE